MPRRPNAAVAIKIRGRVVKVKNSTSTMALVAHPAEMGETIQWILGEIQKEKAVVKEDDDHDPLASSLCTPEKGRTKGKGGG